MEMLTITVAAAIIPAEVSLSPHNLALHFGPGALLPPPTEDFPKQEA